MGRHYSIDGEQLASVTTILQATATEATLVLWQIRTPGHAKQSAISSQRGTFLDEWIKHYLLTGEDMELRHDFRKYLSKAGDWLTQVRASGHIQTDVLVVDRFRKYAGTLDILADDTLIDIKTKKYKLPAAAIHEALVQCFAYSAALLAETGYEVNWLQPCFLTPYSCDPISVSRGSRAWADLEQEWNRRLDQYVRLQSSARI